MSGSGSGRLPTTLRLLAPSHIDTDGSPGLASNPLRRAKFFCGLQATVESLNNGLRVDYEPRKDTDR